MASKLPDYLLKYTKGKEGGEIPKDTKEKKRKKTSSTTSVLIKDESTISAPSNAIERKKRRKGEEEDSDEDESKPIVVGKTEDIKREFKIGLSKDGSGWVDVKSNPSKNDHKISDNQKSSSDVIKHSSGDLSPPRRGGDLSPPRRNNRNEDLSPPRRRGRRSPSPPLSRNNNEDLSPPRRNNHIEDLSPPRRGRERREEKTPRRNNRHDSDSDSENENQSRRRVRHDSDEEDEREEEEEKEEKERREEKEKDKREIKKEEIVIPEIKKGLVTASELAAQLDAQKRRAEAVIDQMTEEESGKNAKTVHRDAITGKKIDMDAVKRQQDEKEDEKKKTLEMMREWGAGLQQKQDREAALLQLEHEKSKPLARYEDDEDMNKEMEENDRWGDPMASYLAKKNKPKKEKKEKKSKKEKKEKKENEGNRKIKLPKERRWKGFTAPGNRYNILPGTAWDGVDRSNGFEAKLLRREGEKAARTEKAYLWSVEDM